ncbi:MAG: SDR family NAD(P)-dependent oxidoreductase [Thermodesulfobacteriota bacterium]
MSNKIAVVTGGARGIGRGIATLLAGRNAGVAIADLSAEEARETAAGIVKAGGTALAVETDITELESVREMVKRINRELGPIDILVNNAGWDRVVPFVKTTPEFWAKVIDINFKGVLNTVYAIAPEMMARNRGRIINIASDAARVGSLGEAVYAGAKGAVISFSKTMARELARNGITVNVICPGPTSTPLFAEMRSADEFAGRILADMDRIIPLKRMGRPEDIGHSIVFLASDEAGYITGQVISVSGGLTMC